MMSEGFATPSRTVNLDDALLESAEEMSHFIRLLASEPEISRVPCFRLKTSQNKVF